MSRIAGVLRRTFGIVRDHVGTDTLGNKYYLIPEQKTWTGKLSPVVLTLASREFIYNLDPCRHMKIALLNAAIQLNLAFFCP